MLPSFRHRRLDLPILTVVALLIAAALQVAPCNAQNPVPTTAGRSLAADSAEGFWRRGHEALRGQRPDYRLAMHCFVQSVGRGGRTALLDIGVMYVNGEGVERNLIEGHAWYELAAKAGVPRAAEYLRDLSRALNQQHVAAARQRSDQIREHFRQATSRSTQSQSTQPQSTQPRPNQPYDTQRVAPGTGTGAGAGATGSPKTLRLRKHTVRDPQVSNVDAFSILIPTDWRFAGKVHWNHNYANLASAIVKATSPDGATFEVMPLIPFTWHRGGVPYFPEGRVYMGSEVRPVTLDTVEFVRRFVQPRCVNGRRSARIIGRQDMPEIARQIEQQRQTQQSGGAGFRASAGRVRLEYAENGKTMHEDIYVVLTATVNPFMPRATDWQPTSLFSLKAEKGRLDAYRDLAVVIAMSTRVTGEWFAGYHQVQQIRINGIRRGIADAGRLSRIIARNGEAIRGMMRDSFRKAQASQDRMADSFSRYLRGVERYNDPTSGSSVSLPSGYENAWVSGTGEYIVSNEVGFNPNEHSTQTWQQMGVTPLGR